MIRYSNEGDSALVAKTLAGENDAYEELVVRHQKKVLAQAFAVTRNEFMAEDAAQDAFVTAWMKLGMLTEPDKFGAWVVRIARTRAVNLLVRMREYESIDGIAEFADRDADVSERIIEGERFEELHRSIDRLPDKIRTVIHLHYFEGLSIAEISKRMKTPAGTVKWQLHRGRQKLRGDLSAMTEKETDTLVEKVMKKVAELRLWRLRSELLGFDEAFADVMADIETLPETKEKYNAKAEVLLLGWQYRPEYKRREKFEEIKEAALAGENEDAMTFVMDSEDGNHEGDDLIEFITKTQIPYLKEHGFTKSTAHEWYKLAKVYYEKGDTEHASEAMEHIMALTEPSDFDRAAALSMKTAYTKFAGGVPDKEQASYQGYELRFVGGDLCRWNNRGGDIGKYTYGDTKGALSKVSLCDSRLYIDGAHVGDVYRATDGSTLTFESDSALVTVPAGSFDGCEVWVTDVPSNLTRVTVYYKEGVGIVKIDINETIYAYSHELVSYYIAGGDGRLPISAGNCWEYAKTGTSAFSVETVYEVVYADASRVMLTDIHHVFTPEEKSGTWDKVLYEVSNNYYDDRYRLIDLSDKFDLLDSLASTPYERTVAKLARSTNERFNRGDKKDSGERGVWNFFQINAIRNEGGVTLLDDEYNWWHSFEWKNDGGGDNADKCLHNMIFDILRDCIGCLWRDEWLDGKKHRYLRFTPWDRHCSEIVCRPAGTVTTAAGTFTDCVEVTITETEFENVGGQEYRGGRMEYTFAPGVGVVRVVHKSKAESIYELSSYEGTGEGYMPVAAGMRRHYDCVNIGGGYFAYADYAIEVAPNGRLALIADLCGQRRLPSEDEMTFRDVLTLIARSYYENTDYNNEHLVDVRDKFEKLYSLANTKLEKTLAEHAERVMTRILEGDKDFNPNRTESGHWNFFDAYSIKGTANGMCLDMDRDYSFQWKDWSGVPYPDGYPMLYNFVWDIIEDNVGTLWSDDWKIEEPQQYKQTRFVLHRTGDITTAAGTFTDCLEMSIDADGFNDGLEYRGGKRECYYAKGVGIIRVVSHYDDGKREGVYELTSYEGTGEGYMPIYEGMRRRYDAVGMPEEYICYTEYACERDEDGKLVIVADQCGCRRINK